MDVLKPEYRGVYQHLQDRFTQGDLATGPSDTYGRHQVGGSWTLDRLRFHRVILEEAKDKCAGLPRGAKAVLLTSGPPGAGKGQAQTLLRARQGDGTELGQALAQAHGVDPAEYVVLDPDNFKEAILRHGGAPTLPAEAYVLPGGLRLAPAELAPLVHRESSFLRDAFESWARSEGFNLLYDGVMADFDWTASMLGNLAREGYTDRVVMSVEVPMRTSLEQNALRWELGRTRFDEGTDSYGGRMAPEPLIRALYPPDQPDSAFSVARTNAERLHSEGLLTGLIEIDRGAWAGTPQPGPHAPAMQHRSVEGDMSISSTSAPAPRPSASAARLRSTGVRKPPAGGSPRKRQDNTEQPSHLRRKGIDPGRRRGPTA
ncbi:zeta toxin family protein [Streptomyces sp. Isolate_45]|uniref:zeta toxin family protein n=1 Tax=Streptomyces sp. Isolate_45 TaxID=2950111 RepID=UPI0024820F15|nr:zeta toxin family protein [Streptomyces sp. Isolate_45]MDA5279898.1 zeta toxin family protein [Streptomyces sp. Isolate_45]